MDKAIEEQLIKIGGSGKSSVGEVLNILPTTENTSSSLDEFSRNISALVSASKTQVEAVNDNTKAVSSNTTAQGSSALKSAVTTIGKSSSSPLLGALGAVPNAIMSIFKSIGGSKSEPPPLVRYELPAPLRLNLANPGTTFLGMSPVDYSAAGTPRSVTETGIGQQQTVAASNAVPAVNIQVQAMDSRSFMDHSQEIAQAVRAAMLNMHSINDVVTDL